MDRIVVCSLAMLTLSSALGGCVESTSSTGSSFVALGTRDAFTYDFTWVTDQPGITIRGTVTGEVQGFVVATDEFGVPRDALAVGYNVTFDEHPEWNVSPRWREFIGVSDAKIIRQENWCPLPAEGCSRVSIRFAVAGHAGLFGMSPFLAFGAIEDAETVGWTVDDTITPSRVAFVLSRSDGCRVATPRNVQGGSLAERGAFMMTFTTPTLTFCGDPLPTKIVSGGFRLDLRDYARSGESVALSVATRDTPPSRFEVVSWSVMPREGEDDASQFLLRDAFAWARENDVRFRTFVDAHPDARVHSTMLSETHRSGDGVTKARTLTREIVLETDSGAGYKIEVRRDSRGTGVLPDTTSAPISSEMRVDASFDRPVARLGTVAAARAIADQFSHPEWSFDRIQSTWGTPLHDRYAYRFGYVGPTAAGSGALALTIPYTISIDSKTGGLIEADLQVSAYFS